MTCVKGMGRRGMWYTKWMRGIQLGECSACSRALACNLLRSTCVQSSKAVLSNAWIIGTMSAMQWKVVSMRFGSSHTLVSSSHTIITELHWRSSSSISSWRGVLLLHAFKLAICAFSLASECLKNYNGLHKSKWLFSVSLENKKLEQEFRPGHLRMGRAIIKHKQDEETEDNCKRIREKIDRGKNGHGISSEGITNSWNTSNGPRTMHNGPQFRCKRNTSFTIIEKCIIIIIYHDFLPTPRRGSQVK